MKEVGEEEVQGVFWKSDGRSVMESGWLQFSIAYRENSKYEKPHYYKNQVRDIL